MKKIIKKSRAFGTIVVPPSKSYAHRLLIASALSQSECTIENVECSKDILATLSCLKSLGLDYTFQDRKIIITKNLDESIQNVTLNCDESGSTLRFFIPLSLTKCEHVKCIGTPRLMSRGLTIYEDIFREQGIAYTKNEKSISMDGRLKSGYFKVKGNVSSQFITGLLFSLPLLDNDSSIEIIPPIESKNYIDITIDVLHQFGIQIEIKDNVYFIKGKQHFKCINTVVEGDYSNAAFLDAFNYYDGSVTLLGLNEKSIQGDKIYQTYFKKLNEGYCEIDLAHAIDLGPILFCFAGSKFGAHFIHTNRLKIKESDRVNSVITELKKFGVVASIGDDEVTIYRSHLQTPTEELFGHNDHRIVMALSVLASVYGGMIHGTEAVSKSFPTFFDTIKQLGIEVEDVE